MFLKENLYHGALNNGDITVPGQGSAGTVVSGCKSMLAGLSIIFGISGFQLNNTHITVSTCIYDSVSDELYVTYQNNYSNENIITIVYI